MQSVIKNQAVLCGQATGQVNSPGFQSSREDERFERLVELGALAPEDVAYLRSGGLKTPELAEKFIENVIGYFQLPLGIATHFRIDDRGLCDSDGG